MSLSTRKLKNPFISHVPVIARFEMPSYICLAVYRIIDTNALLRTEAQKMGTTRNISACGRNFLTKEEKLELLKEYEENLAQELK